MPTPHRSTSTGFGSGGTGVVWVRTVGRNQRGEEVLSFIRWVLVNRREPEVATGVDDAPKTPESVAAADLFVPGQLDLRAFNPVVTGGRAWWEDYEAGERIHHVEGVAIEEAEHQIARIAVAQHVDATGIGRKIAADQATALGAERQRKEPTGSGRGRRAGGWPVDDGGAGWRSALAGGDRLPAGAAAGLARLCQCPRRESGNPGIHRQTPPPQ